MQPVSMLVLIMLRTGYVSSVAVSSLTWKKKTGFWLALVWVRSIIVARERIFKGKSGCQLIIECFPLHILSSLSNTYINNLINLGLLLSLLSHLVEGSWKKKMVAQRLNNLFNLPLLCWWLQWKKSFDYACICIEAFNCNWYLSN